MTPTISASDTTSASSAFHHTTSPSQAAAPVPAIYFRDRQVTMQELSQELAAGRREQRSLILRADRNTPVDLVMQIVNLGLTQGFAVVLATAPTP